MARLALLAVTDAVRPESLQEELGGAQDGSWCRQMSEPVKIQSSFKRGVSWDLPPGLAGLRPDCVRAPPGLEVKRGGLCRQTSEPVKVHATNLSGEFSKRQTHVQVGKLAAEWSDDADDLATSLSTMSGDDLDSDSPSLWASPKLGPQSDPLLPCWVGPDGLSHVALAASLPGRMGTDSLAVMVSSLPRAYTEGLFLEELRDGGFIKKRDFNGFELNLNEGSCYLSFVNVGVMRSFIAAFDGKEMRHASESEFVVVPV